MKMGLFKKFKKEEEKEDIEKSQNIESNIDIKTTDNINDLTYKINLANLSSSIYVVNVEGTSGMKTFKLQTN